MLGSFNKFYDEAQEKIKRDRKSFFTSTRTEMVAYANKLWKSLQGRTNGFLFLKGGCEKVLRSTQE